MKSKLQLQTKGHSLPGIHLRFVHYSHRTPIPCRNPSFQLLLVFQHRISVSGRPSWRGSCIPLHPLVTDSKVQIHVPPLLTAYGVSTRDNICRSLPATQSRSVRRSTYETHVSRREKIRANCNYRRRIHHIMRKEKGTHECGHFIVGA